MVPTENRSSLKLAIPKGRMYSGVVSLLSEAGIDISQTARSYRPYANLDDCEVKILKPQNIVEMLHAGSRDLGFAGADWVAELDGELVELLDTELDPVRVVAAAPAALLVDDELPRQRLVVASEYQRLTRAWITERGLDARFVRSYGATEVFPPDFLYRGLHEQDNLSSPWPPAKRPSLMPVWRLTKIQVQGLPA